MFRLNLLNKNFNVLPIKINQQRNLRQINPIKVRMKNKLTVVDLEVPLNRRYTRTQIDCALVNRIYFRFEVFKNRINLPKISINNYLMKRIHDKAYKKLHNLVVLDEVYADELIDIFSNRENQQISRRNHLKAEVRELNYLIKRTGKTANELIDFGIRFDDNGCPTYGKLRNTMFINLNRSQLARANFYRLLDSKMYSPKFCFDFHPCNISNLGQKAHALFFLKAIFKRNFLSRNPFNIHFTNYQTSYNESIEDILNEKNLPNFLDLRIGHIGEDLTAEDQKLIIITKNENCKQIYYDFKANYLLPLYINNDYINSMAHDYYAKKLSNKSNVEFVHVPTKELISAETPLNFSFYYFVLNSLKDGINLNDSMKNAFYSLIKYTQSYNEYRANGSRRTIHHPSSGFTLEPVLNKKFRFKHFDDLERELL